MLVYQLGHAKTLLYGVEMFQTPGLGPNGFVLKNGPPNNENRQSVATGDRRLESHATGTGTIPVQKEGYYFVCCVFRGDLGKIYIIYMNIYVHKIVSYKKYM